MKRMPYTPRALRLFALLALLLVGVLSLAGVASASADVARVRPPRNVIISASMDGVSTSAVHIWTAEELRAAKPYPILEARGSGRPTAAAPKPTGPTGSIPWQAPQGQPTTRTDGGVSIQSTTLSPPYTSFPASANGRLFFTQNGISYSCSASMIKDHSIWTAGHCVHAGNNSANGWSTNMTFIPQYYNGSAPLGQCSVYNIWTHMDWYTNGNPNGLDHDYAGGAIGCSVVGSTGKYGFAWNWPYPQQVKALGYPADPPFTGQSLVQCDSSFYRFDIGTPRTYGIVCDMTGGSSGGPWGVSTYYLNGNTSYGYLNDAVHLYSPYFDGDAKLLWDILPD